VKTKKPSCRYDGPIVPFLSEPAPDFRSWKAIFQSDCSHIGLGPTYTYIVTLRSNATITWPTIP